MDSQSPYSLVKEMLEAPGVMRRFSPMQIAHWTRAIDAKKRLFLSGEGASRIFPAKNMIDLALRRNSPWHICTEGARQAAEYDLKDFVVIGASNSGRTRELIALFEKLKHDHITTYGVTAAAGSRLAEIADHSLQLSCGAEKAIAATKSVIEEALVYQSLLRGDEWKNLDRAAGYCEAVLTQTIAPDIIEHLKKAPLVYFSGRNNGVAEELALKTNEIMHRKSGYLEGTYALHGIEEVMQKGEVVVLVEPFVQEIEKYRTVLAKGAGITVIAIASFDTPFPTIKVPALEGFNGYIQLLAGWNMLVAAALASGINPDKTTRARKVGNEI
jgi:glucosamine--fructose-6-phosphate aminotransferase (isomerizing)